MVEISNLVKTFGQFTAVDNLSMQVNEGEVFGMLGLNGAGKSTTMRCMLSLIKPDSGQIKFFGKNISTDRNYILGKIGCLIEKSDHYNYLSAHKNLLLSSKLSRYIPTQKEIDFVFELVGLKGREHQQVKTFSQGMKQRLGIANTLIHNPSLIILDEPANGLDPQGIIDLRNLILRLKNEWKKTIILSSHILSEIELIADSMVIIHKGKNVVQGKTNDLLSGNEVVVEVEVDDSSKVEELISKVLPTLPSKIIDLKKISIKMQKSDLNQLHRELVNKGINVYNFTTRNKLEDYFLKLTHENEQPVFNS